jgi:hypothetical protein
MPSLWIKIEHTTPDKPEVFAMATALNLDPDSVTGKLIRFWIWADQQIVSCNAPTVTKSLLDRITFCDGFADALIQVGWLAEDAHGLVIPGFERHNGQTAKARGVTNNRVSKHRYKCNAPTVTDVTPAPLTKPLPDEDEEEEISKLALARARGSRQDELPTAAQVIAYAKSAPVPISPECAAAFHDTQEAQGWVVANGLPIRDWRAALRRYASGWNERERGKLTNAGKAKQPINRGGYESDRNLDFHE